MNITQLLQASGIEKCIFERTRALLRLRSVDGERMGYVSGAGGVILIRDHRNADFPTTDTV
jgi:hypothetical protein